MPLVVADRVRETTTTTGTGTVTLAGAVNGYQSFSAIGNGNTTYYTINAGSQWEVGIGTYTGAGPSLSRDTVLESSNSGSLVDFAAGPKDVFVTYPAEKSISDGYGLLPVANGGTGATTLTANGVLLGNGTSAISATAVGATGQVLVGNTGAAPTWSTLSGIGVTSFAGGTTGLTPASATTGAITLAGTLAVANGGTGATTLSAGYLVKGNGTSAASASVVYDDGTNVGIGTSANYGGRLNLVPAATPTTFAGGNTFQIGEATGNTNYRLQLGYINHATAGYIGSVQAYTGVTGSPTVANLTLQGVGGNVGVGTAVPAEKLDVAGNLQVTGGSAKLILYSNQTIASVNTAGSAYTDMLLDGLNLVFRTGSGSASERMRIDSAGFVGIGTSSPSTLLHVAGDNSPVVLNQNTVGSIAAFTALGVTYGASFGVNADGTYITSAANTVFSVSGSETMRINSSGNVGIGTSAPTYKLHVATTGVNALGVYRDLDVTSVGAAGQLIELGARNGSTFTPGATITGVLENPATTGYMSFATRSSSTLTERMRIDSSGSVGIGTTSPLSRLTVQQSADGFDQGFSLGRVGADRGTIFLNATGNTMNFGRGSATSMTINSIGNVGIGTSSPSGNLHINGTAAGSAIETRITNTSATGFSTVTFGDGTTTFGQIWAGNASYGSFGGAASLNYSANSGPHVWYTNYTERMRIDASGNVGIGTSSSTAKVTISLAAPNVAGGQLIVKDPNYSGVALVQGGAGEGYLWNTSNNFLSIATNNTERMRLDASGNLGIGTSSPGQKLTVAGTIETTSGGVKYPDGTTQTTGALEKVDVYSTAGSTTWTKPSWATSIEVILIGGGGGGGSGRKGAAGTLRCGGGGGSGGGFSTTIFPASYVGATETVTVGAGGTGGASQTTNSTNGNNATNGGDTSFGTKLYAPGGGGGAGGTASSGSPGTIARGTTAGGQGALSTSGGGSAAGIGATATGSTGSTYGGGGGGSVTTGNAVTNGGQGVNTTTGTAPSWKIGGFSVVPTSNSVTGNGNSGTDNGSGVWLGGESGDGGAASTSGNAFNGGNGAKWGSAGGGGGGAVDSVGNSGTGGDGGAGIAIVISRG
jgi:hypothetical protein